MEESSTYRAILSKGLERGRIEGLNAGRVEGLNAGRVEGRVEGLRLSLVTFLEQKFGSIPKEIESTIREITDETRLEAAIRQLPSIVGPADLKL